MTAYANLVSLMNLIEHVQLYHAHHPMFLDEHQKVLDSLQEKVTNLQDLLEWCSLKGCNEARHLESRIADAAVGAEDIIELYVVGVIHSQSMTKLISISPNNFIGVHKMDPIFFSEEVEKVTEFMDFMEKEMMKIKEKSLLENQVRLPNLQTTGSPESHLDGNSTDMVGFQDEFNEIMSKITGHGSNLKIISITGMGGIGKSTLARSVCDNRSSTNYFDVRGWIIFSQDFNVKRRMFDLLKEIEVIDAEYDAKKYDYHELGEKLHKHLSGRRFLIIVDDIWSINDLAKFRLFLPDNNNGSRIILTTRLLNVAKDVGSSHIYSMNFLDENTSWSLLCKKVFLNKPCPPKLLEVGKKIAKNCKGLPLSLSVIGGLLAKLEKTRDCWEKIAGEINVIVAAQDDERYLNILALSYSHLPIYLKPCFLYIGIFPEDYSMDVSSLIDLWISEGFLKLRGASKNLEEVAQNCLEDLVQRSLLYVSKIGDTGKIEDIRIHDLLRDLALREAQKHKFLNVATLRDPNFSMIINRERRVGLHDFMSFGDSESEWINALSTTSVRSFMGDRDSSMVVPVVCGMRLVRISRYAQYFRSRGDIFHLINSRYLTIFDNKNLLEIASIQLLWNLQIVTLYRTEGSNRTIPIWAMPLLRKLDLYGCTFPDPPLGRLDGNGDLVVTNVRKIKFIWNLICTDAVLRKISNIKELGLLYAFNVSENEYSHYCLNNLVCLCTLQILEIRSTRDTSPDQLILNIEFPQSLRSLCLHWCSFQWEHLTTKVGSLPHLEKLSLYDCCTGEEWILDEDGAFLCLKVLKIVKCRALLRWSAESIHFPCLEHLFLEEMESLEEIPFDIGDIASLQTIQLWDCSKSIVASAKMILKEQRSFGNDSLRILVNQKHIQEGGGGGDGEEENDVQGEQEKRSKGVPVVPILVRYEEEEEVEESGGGRDEEEKDVHGEQEKKRSKGFVAFVVPILVIVGFSYLLLHNKFRGRRKEKVEDSKDKQRRNEADDSWFSFYDYP